MCVYVLHLVYSFLLLYIYRLYLFWEEEWRKNFQGQLSRRVLLLYMEKLPWTVLWLKQNCNCVVLGSFGSLVLEQWKPKNGCQQRMMTQVGFFGNYWRGVLKGQRSVPEQYSQCYAVQAFQGVEVGWASSRTFCFGSCKNSRVRKSGMLFWVPAMNSMSKLKTERIACQRAKICFDAMF